MQHARLLSIAIGVLALATTADAKPKKKPSAKPHIDKATKAHKDGKFDVALTELKAAYEIDPQPKLLFAIAQVHAKLDDCPSAIENYEKFLAKEKDKKKHAVVKQAIAACKTKTPDTVAAKPDDKSDKKDVFRKEKPVEEPAPPPVTEVQPTPTPPPVETEPPPAPDPLPPAPTPTPVVEAQPPPMATITVKKPFYKDIIGDVLVVGGVAVGVVSFIQYRGALGKLDEADDATTLDAYDAALTEAHDKRKISLILAGGSVALVAAGVLRYALHTGTETRRVAIVPTQSGGLITWSGGF